MQAKNKKKSSSKPDMIMVGIVGLWIFLGFLILIGVSFTISQRFYSNPWHFVTHQLIFGYLPGIVLAILAYKMNLEWLKKFCLPALLAILFLMALVFLPATGTLLGGAKRWVSIGPISFQPSEFLKLAFIIYLAAWLAKQGSANKKSFLQLLVPLVAILGAICALLVAQPDISTLGVIVAVAVILYFLAETPFYHTLILFLLGSGGLAALIFSAPYRLNRFLVFLRPDTQPLGIGYQLQQSLISIGSGGLTGSGLGLSAQKAAFLPQPMTDTIFAVFAEEAGFIGAMLFILLVLVFAWRGFKIARNCSNDFFRLTAIGITSWLVVQSFINIGAVTGTLPVTGIPLPFISYGGSHLIASLIGIGILLNISKKANY